MDGIVEIFERSLDSNLRYTTYIGDGDSAVENAIKTEVCYGGIINKVDCINHKIKVSGGISFSLCELHSLALLVICISDARLLSCDPL